ncbi:gp31 protein [Mycobacterium europaeum]|uniref:Gp31 protein n=1 Tax=Mycobacterium europaeum TaxID=761804 RepID=A0A0U1CZA1_9MYCO|nr:hypothetical protein [Mycobacterium europaeum]CQD03781.1 gp31 protein [Mycobacterium europaeum]
MTGLPATGGTWAQVLEDSLNPLNERFWQVTHVLARDYDPTGVFNLASPSVGLGTAGLFTPFAADNISIRQDLLFDSPGPNQGFYSPGMLKEDDAEWTLDETVTGSPSAQYVRSTRGVITKLDDKVHFTPIESNPVVDCLQYELPLVNVPVLGTPGYQVARGGGDVPVERVIVMIGIDTDANLLARVFPRCVTDKKGKSAMDRKAADSMPLDYTPMLDPFTKKSMWICRAGSQWLGAGNLNFETTAPVVTPITGLDANIAVPTPIDIESPVWTVALQQTAGGAFTAATLSGTPTVSGNLTTVKISGLTASTTYNAVQVTATGTNATVTSPVSAPFTSTAS